MKCTRTVGPVLVPSVHGDPGLFAALHVRWWFDGFTGDRGWTSNSRDTHVGRQHHSEDSRVTKRSGGDSIP